VLAAIAADVFWPPRDVPADWDDYAALFVGAPEQCFEAPWLPGRLNHAPEAAP